MTTEVSPADALRPILARLATLAHERGVTAYLVGGSVRDALLNRTLHDLDIAVDRNALEFARAAADRLGGHYFALDDEHAVARVSLDAGEVHHIDVAQLQGSLTQDMRRRDFTIDALAAPIEGGAVVDVCGGLADLDARLLRMNGASVFDDDPLRLLRGVRIAAELSFEIETATEAAMRQRAHRVTAAAAERQRDELARLFACDDAYRALRLLDRVGLLDILLPEVAVGRGVEQPNEHAYDAFEHAMHAVEAMDIMLAERARDPLPWIWRELWSTFDAPSLRAYLAEEMREGQARAAILKLAALLHDVAKPQTKTMDADGRVRFFGHADAGAETASRILRRLRFSAREIRFVSLLIAEHLRPGQLAAVGEAPTRRALYRFFRDLGDAASGVLLLSLADAASARGPRMTPEGWGQLVGYMNGLLVRSREEEGIVNAPPLLDGNDIMSRFGIPEGPVVGAILAAVREAQGAGEIADRDAALLLAEHIAWQQREHPS